MKKQKPVDKSYKMYNCRSVVRARTLSEARRIAMKKEPDEIWINEDWKAGNQQNLAEAIGFHADVEDGEEDDE